MKLLFIYGPPAVGKLTVANEVAKRTGFKVFHNHLSIDAILPVFEFGSKPFFRLVEMIRVETVAEAARQGVDVIYTFCYAKGLDEMHVEKVENAVRENGGEALFALLTCDPDELKRRVVLEDRRKFKKANTVEMIEKFLETYDLSSPIPDSDTLVIDNTSVSPDAAAGRIVEHFRLK
ncbi:MAG: AAA family ATPase [Acidobacteria bacterium]|nr:AAA family ATPase [Acidobacteriota bacterium]